MVLHQKTQVYKLIEDQVQMYFLDIMKQMINGNSQTTDQTIKNLSKIPTVLQKDQQIYSLQTQEQMPG